jgi:hypothetical protein
MSSRLLSYNVSGSALPHTQEFTTNSALYPESEEHTLCTTAVVFHSSAFVRDSRSG